MSRPEIPGFYFDEARNRYFKLTTASTGVTTSKEYSQSRQVNLKRKAESANFDDNNDGEDVNNIGSRIQFDTIRGLELPEKYLNGDSPTLADRACQSLVYAGYNSRGKRTLQNVLATSLLRPFDFLQTRSLAQSSPVTRLFVMDTNRIFWGNESGIINYAAFSQMYYSELYKDRKNFGFAHSQPNRQIRRDLMNPSRKLMRFQEHFHQSSLNIFSSHNMITDISGFSLDLKYSLVIACSMGHQQTPGKWGIFLNPLEVQSENMAIKELKFGDGFCVELNKSMIGSCGTNNGLIITEVRPETVNMHNSSFINEDSDVLSVVYLNEFRKPRALIGCRNGNLINMDYNEKASKAVKQKVTSGISALKNIKENYVLVAGIGNEMKLFDLRMMSESVLQYHGYENENNPYARVSISTQGDKIAHVSSENCIQIFDTWNGQQLEFPNSTLATLHNGEDPIDSRVVDLQWFDYNRSSGLLVATKGGITRYEIC